MRTRALAVVLAAAAATTAIGCGSAPPPPAEAPSPAATLPAGPAGAAAAPLPSAAAAPTSSTSPAAPPRATGHPKADLIPRAVLFGNPDRASVQISPDGAQLAWLAAKDGVLNVWVAPLGKPDQARAVTSDTRRPIRSFLWAYTGRDLLYTQDQGGDENFHVYRVDLGSGKVTDLTPYDKARATIEGLSAAHPTTIMVSTNDRDPKLMDLYAIDLRTGKRTLIALNDHDFAGWTLDHDLALRFATKSLPDGSVELYRTPATRTPPADGKRAWTKFDTVPPDDANTTQIIGATPDGKGVYLTESRGRDTAALVAQDLATGKQTTIASDPKADVDDTLIDPRTDRLQAVAFDYTRLRWDVVDKSVAADLAGIAKLAPGIATISSRTADDKRWIVATRSDVKPGQYWLWDRATHAGAFLFDARPDLASYKLAAMTPVEIPTRDGLTEVGYVTLPAGADADGDGKPDAPLPMVLWVHGGPWFRDHWGPNPVHQLLADRGYAVLSVNFRGSSGFGKKFLNAANLQWGKAMHADLLDAVAWAEKAGIAAPHRTCIGGGSYGGYATLAGLSMTPDAFACGVDLVGPSNLLTLLATVPPYWAPLIAMFHTRMGDPTTPAGKALLVAASPLTHAAAITKPLLIGQGANDPRVNQAESEQIVAAMTQHHLPVSYLLFPDEGHGFARPENNIAFFGAAEAFLSAHLGGVYLPLTTQELSASSMQVKAGGDGVPGLQP